MQTYTYQSRNPLARYNPLRSVPLYRAPEHILRPVHTPLFLAQWELDRATPCVPSAEEQYAYARKSLGQANRYPRGIARRNAQSQAMRFLNRSRADLRAARKRYAAAVGTVLALSTQPELPFAS